MYFAVIFAFLISFEFFLFFGIFLSCFSSQVCVALLHVKIIGNFFELANRSLFQAYGIFRANEMLVNSIKFFDRSCCKSELCNRIQEMCRVL